MKKENLELHCTCLACPEQYDVYDKEEHKNVGYIRYRHGWLSVNPFSMNEDGKWGIDWGTELVSDFIGDSMDGVLEASKRDDILSMCLDVIVAHYNKNQENPEQNTENMFEGIKFGDKFLTRGGKVAIFLHKVGTNGYLDKDKNFYRFGTNLETFAVNYEGSYNNSLRCPDCLDIVSKYQEPIDEEQLREKAYEWISFVDDNDLTAKTLALECAMMGYKKAKEEEK